MARIRIELPSSFDFSALIPVRITDLNYGNHVGNDTVLSLLHEARMQFLMHHGYTEMQFEGCGMIMSDAAIEFKAELFYGNTLRAYMAAGNFNRVGFDLYYKLVKNDEETLVALAKTAMICYDYDTKKIVSLPDKARRTLSGS